MQIKVSELYRVQNKGNLDSSIDPGDVLYTKDEAEEVCAVAVKDRWHNRSDWTIQPLSDAAYLYGDTRAHNGQAD